MRFLETPPLPLYPPRHPSDLITLWQGISIGLGFFPHAFATARAEFGFPIAKELNSGVVLVSLDFLKKELVFGKEFMPTGDDKQDILNIKEYYNAFTPKNPANF